MQQINENYDSFVNLLGNNLAQNYQKEIVPLQVFVPKEEEEEEKNE